MKAKSSLLKASFISAVLGCALALPFALPSSAQTDSRGLNINIRAEDGREIKLYDKSYALVIGVSDYTQGWPKLPGVKKDIEEVARALERQGFQVTKVENPDSAQLDKAFKEFIDLYGINVENRLLFYFAGHGHTIKQSYGEEMGYIVPTDAPNPLRDQAGFMSKAMDMQQMELYARRIQAKHALFLFDSCFSGSFFALSRAIPESIGYKTARPVRQFITSGSADETVPDRSIFREQFIAAIEGEADGNRDGYVTGTELGEFLQDKVVNYSRNAQHPQYGKIRNPNLDKGDFVFALPKAAANSPPVAANATPTIQPAAQPAPARVDSAQQELAFWSSIENSTDAEDFRDYLSKYPKGLYAGIAQRRIATLSSASKPAPTNTPNSTSANTTSAARPSTRPQQMQNHSGIEFVWIPSGSFMMGSENGRDEEKPVHRVTIADGFYMGKYEVTQAQWQAVMGNNPSDFKGENNPVEQVSWGNAVAFINKLNEMNDGYKYRLPTEAEWEYACRAGTTGDYAGDLDKMGWNVNNSGNATHPVGQKQPNAFGLYDMHGNVWEWCQDRYHGNYIGAPTDGSAWLYGGSSSLWVLRGGSYGNYISYLRSASKLTGDTDYRGGSFNGGSVGFRLVAVALP